ncbi:hypothetical protein A4X09_0g2273 [Tilletia walkeri]|uniref:Uncharacterized protein n=1 Tax=Tilletia walkeri TaxID=117179 RepID=A0A8X7NDL1_9BASI|nr:hypothetical protein A4X09_0g2273 [Tilletia walkeri]
MSTAASTTPTLQAGIVRSVLSGDTLIVRPKGVATPGSERAIHIAGIAAPRMGSRDRDDEPQAFPSREHLRLLLVGREIRYKVEYTVPIPGASGPGREFAHVFLPPKAQGQQDTNVAAEILAAGWAKVHDSTLRRNGVGPPNGAQLQQQQQQQQQQQGGAAAGGAQAQTQLMPEEDEEAGGWKAKLRAIQDDAQASQRGIWGPDDSLIKVDYTMPEDSHTFLQEWKGKPIDSVVEQVRDGSMLRVRLFLTPKHHQLINLNLAGIKAPRVPAPNLNPAFVNNNDGNSPQAEPYGEESKFFVESRLLQRNVKVTILSMPQPASVPTPFGSTSLSSNNGPAPPTATVLIGTALHPVGDIAHFLLTAGLARCVDWHAGVLSSVGGMEKYRIAERAAKDKRLGIWKDYAPSASANAMAGQPTAKRTFEAVVGRIISGDTIHVFVDDDGSSSSGKLNERRIQLSSVRQALIKDSKQAGYANEAREFLRKRLIGKNVIVQIDYIKPKDGDFDERHYATVRSGGKETNIAELLVQRGLATVQRHKRDDEDRSPEYDRLMEAEASAMAEQRGLHSGKESPAPRMGDASDNAAKANSFLPGLKRAGRVPAIIDFVASASRFKLIVPRENVRLTFVLAGIRAPRTARNPHEKDEAFGREGLEWTTRRALQRDVEVEFIMTDKAGGFIGNLYLNKSENLAVSLVGEGFASVHAYSAENLGSGNALYEAERKAQAGRLNLWRDFEGEVDGVTDGQEGGDGAGGALVGGPSGGATGHSSAVQGAGGATRSGGAWGSSASKNAEPAPARREYADVIISDVRGNGTDVPFSFAVQILDDKITELETLMQEIALHSSSPPASAGFTPRAGEYVCAKFSQDGAWYRAQVKKATQSSKKAEVHYVDYGNFETVPFSDIRPLDSGRFGRTRLAPQAKEARLSFVKLFEGSSDGKQVDYVLDAQDRFREWCEGRKLIANIDFRESLGTGSGAGERLHLTLYDPSNPSVVGSPEACINVDLAREGWALPDEKVAYWKSYPGLVKALEEANEEARRRHRGVFEYGDPTETQDGPAGFRR